MDYLNKSKEELIIELKGLQQDYDSLKESYNTDIAERKQIEKELRLNQERLLLTLNVTQIGIWDWDLKNDNWYASPIYYTMLGYEPVYGASDREIWLERIHPEDREAVSEKIKKVLNRESNEYSYEARMKHANGSYRWHNVIGNAIEWDNNKPIRLIGVRIDITERKQSELLLIEKNNEIEAQNEELMQINEELNQINQELIFAKDKAEESAETYHMLFESINDAVFVSEMLEKPDSRKFVRVNDVACQRLGYTREELLTMSPFDINSENAKQKYSSVVQKLIENKHGIVEMEHVTKDGKLIPVEISTKVTQFRNKTIFHSVVRDITERKQAEEAILQKTALFEALLNTTIDGIIIVDKEGKKVFQNQRIIELFNIPQNLADNIDDQYQLQYVISVTKNPDQFAQRVFYLYDHPEETGEDEVELKNGKILYRYSAPVLSKDKHNYGRIWSFRDITESKQAEKAIIVAKEKAEESDRLKTAFLQNMSHEIRTPMNAIMGFSDLLSNNYNNKAKLEKFSEIINQRCNDLLEIINDILDIAKIESGQLLVNNEECNLNELFTELSAFFIEYRNRIGKQQIRFHLQALCDPSDSIIVTDKVKLKQIFINLISNAFKFTDEGKIEGGCRFDKNNNLQFYVSDTGIGISADKQKVVFERFVQLHHGPKKNIGGTGLGLSIVKGLVNLLGGEIFLESELNRGSTFSFSFPFKTTPLAQHEPKKIDATSDSNLLNKNILIVEDDFYNSEYLKEILSGVGLNILHAEDGKEAIEIAMSQPIDIVLMDIRLPDMNGYAATRQIQQYKPHLKIIAHTAYAAQDEKQKAIDAGCCDYISKPTKQDTLLSMLNKHLL